MGRRPGPAKSRKETNLETRQVDYLNALIETAEYGRPSFVSLVRHAVDDFIERALSNPEVRARVERHLKQRKVIALRDATAKK